MRGFCATFATKSGKELCATLLRIKTRAVDANRLLSTDCGRGTPERKTGKIGMTGRIGRAGIPVTSVPLVPLVPPVSLAPPRSRVSFLIPAPRAHLKPSLSVFLQKNSARFSAFFQKIFCYLCIFNTRFSDHSCHPSHFFHCTHFTYLSHTYYYIRGRLLLLKKTQC